ncbi:MAG: MarR family winged helix-turn-helix transcriptional regulator [Clostridia bacterium]|nr:MarR family winged helix-turn-helix transcriptional regulator [Clostridia bacterium]
MDRRIETALRGRKFKRYIERTYDDLRERFGLRQIEIELLLYLALEPRATASEISRVLELNKGQVSQSFDRLCKEGYLNAETDPADRRFNIYTLTEKSTGVVCAAEKIKQSVSEKIFGGIDADELATAERVAIRILENIDRLMEDGGNTKEKHGGNDQ